jgi:hypothetical protein
MSLNMRDHVYLPDLDLTRISEESISQNLSHVIDEAAGRTTNEHIYGYGEPHNTQNMVGMSISFTHDQGLDCKSIPHDMGMETLNWIYESLCQAQYRGLCNLNSHNGTVSGFHNAILVPRPA